MSKPIQEFIAPRNPYLFPGKLPDPATLRFPVEVSPGYVVLPSHPAVSTAMEGVPTQRLSAADM